MNRHLRGDMLPVIGTVPDCVTVKPGDLVFLARYMHLDVNRSLASKSGGTNYVYPYSAGVTHSALVSGSTTFAARFLGIALDDSPKGSTDSISIATAGVFEFPLTSRAGVTIGKLAAGIAPTGFSTSSQTTGAYSAAQSATYGCSIGWVYRTQSSASKVAVFIRTSYGPGGIASN